MGFIRHHVPRTPARSASTYGILDPGYKRGPLTQPPCWLPTPREVPNLWVIKLIAQANAEYEFTAWSRYDTAFRLWASKTPGARWDTINNHLWAQCFTGRASAQVICFTCGQPGHWSSTCPLGTESNFRPTMSSSTPPSTSARATDNQEICRQFNAGRCRYQSTPDQCKYAHRCLSCHGRHPEHACTGRRTHRST